MRKFLENFLNSEYGSFSLGIAVVVVFLYALITYGDSKSREEAEVVLQGIESGLLLPDTSQKVYVVGGRVYIVDPMRNVSRASILFYRK